MRALLTFLLLAAIAESAVAAQSATGNRLSLIGKGTYPGDGAVQPRTGGDTIAEATTIWSLPYQDSGATCGFTNDYDEICPYSGSTAPDVVYSYTPSGQESINVDLCASSYDTKVYIYAGGPDNLVACNDDAGCGYSGWQSELQNVPLSPGVTYYIVVDGYGSSCGSYVLGVDALVSDCLCAPGLILEGEPPCGENYVDSYNGGCNSNPHVFQPLYAVEEGCITLCGQSGTYLYQGMSYRDTDWFDCTGIGENIDVECFAEFPLQLIFIWNPDCGNLQYDLITAGWCDIASLSRFVGAGDHCWVWVGPQIFSGLGCGAHVEYTLTVCGIAGAPPVPVRGMSWGGIKGLYR